MVSDGLCSARLVSDGLCSSLMVSSRLSLQGSAVLSVLRMLILSDNHDVAVHDPPATGDAQSQLIQFVHQRAEMLSADS